MKSPKLVTALAAVTASLFFSGCSDDKEASNADNIKSNYVNMAYAVYSDSLDTAKALESSIDTFLENPTDETLQQARDAYKAARKPYQQSEIMRWDSDITADKNLADEGGLASVDEWEGQVNAWPLEEIQIESIIDGSETITSQLLIDRNGSLPNGTENEANVTTGVHAIEFLLWDKDENFRGAGNRAISDFGKTEDCVNGSDATECRTSKYLETAVELLVLDLTAMQKEWSTEAQTTPGTLAHNFLNDDNALDYMLQAIGSMSVGELGGARLSAGLWRPDVPFEGELKEGLYEEEHDCFSDLSHVAVYYNFVGVQNAWNGTYTKLDGTVIRGGNLANYTKSIAPKIFLDLDAVFASVHKDLTFVYNAGEKDGDDRKSFDQIIHDSYLTYEKGAEKSAELKAVESSLVQLAKVRHLVVDLGEALSLDGLNEGDIGTTD